MQTTQTRTAGVKTISELVAQDYRRAHVIKKYEIDFSCGGNRTIAEACHAKGISPNGLDNALLVLEVADAEESSMAAYESWEPVFLAAYIVNMHHTYLREAIPILREYLNKLVYVYGQAQPSLITVAGCFAGVARELEAHMQQQESVLFPYIKQLEQAKRTARKQEAAFSGFFRTAMSSMEAGQAQIHASMQTLRRVTANYKVPADACTIYLVTFKMLQELESDLARHTHLEHNILFPKVLELEKAAVN